jgi:hypothetical protein
MFALGTPETAVLARLGAGAPTGFWTSDPVLSGAVRATIDRLIAGKP